MAWQVLVELARRHRSYWIIEAHPGGGQYDCLSLSSGKALVIDLNLCGSIHGASDGPDSGWIDLAVKGAFSTARRLGQAHNLPVSSALPNWNRRTVAYGFVAGALSLAMAYGAQERWTTENGFYDSSGYGSGVRDGHFAAFPRLRERLEIRHPHDPLGEPAYRFWFLLRDREPVLAVETSGRVWNRAGREEDLLVAHDTTGSLVQVLVEFCIPLIRAARP